MSRAGTSRSELSAESKDLYTLSGGKNVREFPVRHVLLPIYYRESIRCFGTSRDKLNIFNPRLKSLIVSSLRPRMGLIVNIHHVLDRELGIALRGREALVPQQFLDGAQVRSFFQHVRAEGVTQSMRMNLGR